jgi:DGQHR domain-containing protein
MEISVLVEEKTYSSLEEAQQRAGAEVANTGGFSVPVVRFRQGSRRMLTGALPISWMKSRLETRSAGRQGSIHDTRSAMNRPEIAEHTRAIAKYLRENHNKKYIVPPLTLNIQQKVHLYTVDYPAEFLPGYLVIAATAKLAITDGQHRRSAIIAALDEMESEQQAEFGRDAVAVMISCETELAQIHQDFADCSKTKPLPPSLLAVYDLRNPANRLVADLESKCALFKDRIDSTSKTLSRKSTYLFLANQVRQLVKELLTGSYATQDAVFELRANEQLARKEQYQEVLARYSEYINYLTGVIPVWRDIARVKAGSLEASQIPAKRQEGWVCLTATGLNLIGRVGHVLFTKGTTNWKDFASRLGEIDWRKSAPIWQGNILMGQKVMTQQGPLQAAFKNVSSEIGLDPQLGWTETVLEGQTA